MFRAAIVLRHIDECQLVEVVIFKAGARKTSGRSIERKEVFGH